MNAQTAIIENGTTLFKRNTVQKTGCGTWLPSDTRLETAALLCETRVSRHGYSRHAATTITVRYGAEKLIGEDFLLTGSYGDRQSALRSTVYFGLYCDWDCSPP